MNYKYHTNVSKHLLILANIKTELKLMNASSQTSTSKQLITTANNLIVPVLGFSLNLFTQIFAITFKN